ncbi:MAG: hypothetical protein AAFZ80_13715, partial [Cyanobacteria bacterium P01_A01_bin.105]
VGGHAEVSQPLLSCPGCDVAQRRARSVRPVVGADVRRRAQLPVVASDPTMLQQVLTGLVELFAHSVPTASHIDLQVMAAGDQLKLQFQAHQAGQPVSQSGPTPALQSLGHLLMFQPDTGGLSLNLNATKTLFQALGAKLTVRDRAATWTVFLPIETTRMAYPIV